MEETRPYGRSALPGWKAALNNTQFPEYVFLQFSSELFLGTELRLKYFLTHLSNRPKQGHRPRLIQVTWSRAEALDSYRGTSEIPAAFQFHKTAVSHKQNATKRLPSILGEQVFRSAPVGFER